LSIASADPLLAQRPPVGIPEALTPRQIKNCLLLSFGNGNSKIAETLGCSLRTVELDHQHVSFWLGINSGRHLVVWAVENRDELLAAVEPGWLEARAAADADSLMETLAVGGAE
jgi:DNA-binding NarL/FixJ family response regulator